MGTHGDLPMGKVAHRGPAPSREGTLEPSFPAPSWRLLVERIHKKAQKDKGERHIPGAYLLGKLPSTQTHAHTHMHAHTHP